MAALGKFPAAILVFGEIIKNHPRSSLVPAAWGRKGDCSFTLGASDPQRYAEAARAYQFLIESRDTPPDIRWQAEYKLGQTLEKQGDPDSALQHLLSVVYGVTSETGRMDPAAAVWFARAVLDAGTMLESRSRRPEAAALYRKLADAGLSASEEAAARIRKLQSAKAAPPRASGS
ncbi:MAG: tetratricopeptide repeat protein [Kiritimatiellia bacterium]